MTGYEWDMPDDDEDRIEGMNWLGLFPQDFGEKYIFGVWQDPNIAIDPDMEQLILDFLVSEHFRELSEHYNISADFIPFGDVEPETLRHTPYATYGDANAFADELQALGAVTMITWINGYWYVVVYGSEGIQQ